MLASPRTSRETVREIPLRRRGTGRAQCLNSTAANNLFYAPGMPRYKCYLSRRSRRPNTTKSAFKFYENIQNERVGEKEEEKECERERGGGRKGGRKEGREGGKEKGNVCLCEREREIERENESAKERERKR